MSGFTLQMKDTLFQIHSIPHNLYTLTVGLYHFCEKYRLNTRPITSHILMFTLFETENPSEQECYFQHGTTDMSKQIRLTLAFNYTEVVIFNSQMRDA